jgi:sugar phosphate isomerase/epimerase
MTGVFGRRAFLAGASAVSVFPAASVTATQPTTAPNATPRRRPKLSCNLYSFDAPLRRGTMSLAQAIELCAELGFEAVDPTGYYFTGYPKPPADEEANEIKRLAFSLGLAISGTGIRNDFTLPEPAQREAELARVEAWLPVASRLGAPVLRIFDGRAEAKTVPRERMTDWVVEGFRRCAELGARHGVIAVYQNHNEHLRTATEVLAVRERVGSKWFGLNVDIGSLRTTADPYEEVARLAPYACTWQIKQTVYRREVEEKTDLKRIAAILRESGYRGWLPLETLGPGDPKEKVRRWLAEVQDALA